MELWSQNYNAPQISPNFGTSHLWNPTPRTEGSSFSRSQNIYLLVHMFYARPKIDLQIVTDPFFCAGPTDNFHFVNSDFLLVQKDLEWH